MSPGRWETADPGTWVKKIGTPMPISWYQRVIATSEPKEGASKQVHFHQRMPSAVIVSYGLAVYKTPRRAVISQNSEN